MATPPAEAVPLMKSEVDESFLPAPCDWFDDDETLPCAEAEIKTKKPDFAAGSAVIATSRISVSEPPSPPPSPSPPSSPPQIPRRKPTRRARPAQTLPPVGAPLPSPSWNELSSRVLPQAAQELLSNSVLRVCYLSRKTYVSAKWYYAYSELGNTGGYFRPSEAAEDGVVLPAFSSLSWVDRQMVQEWRTYANNNQKEDEISSKGDEELDDDDFVRARTLVPTPLQRPKWQHAETCHTCHVVFGPTRLRHHCRQCGHSYCQDHSAFTHPLPHLGYAVQLPERVCDACKRLLLAQNLGERIAWRQARCRDYLDGNLTPYFETAVDTVEQVLLRVTQAALHMAKSVPLGAQATVAVETADVLRKHGLNGIYTIMLRQEFLAAADLLRKALGINRTAWPLSVHELSAAIFYALAQHRALRGINPEREEWIHRIKDSSGDETALPRETEDGEQVPNKTISDRVPSSTPSCIEGTTEPVCSYVPDRTLSSLIFFAPIALNFIYAEKEVDMQLLAAQQGWRLVYACLEQEMSPNNECDKPASALFVHEGQKVACVAIRGTATIHDIVTDIRQIPVPFPPDDIDQQPANEQGWTTVSRGQGLAVCGMAGAAATLYREHIDALVAFAKKGYRIRLTGHSLGGGVAALLGVLVLRDLKPLVADKEVPLLVYTFGATACVDSDLADFVEDMVVSVVHHDDVVPRMTPSSCRDLLKHLLHIRETWVKEHLENDLMAVTERASSGWAPRWRTGFTLPAPTVTMKKYYPTPSSIRRYYRRKVQSSSRSLMQLHAKLMGARAAVIEDSRTSDPPTKCNTPSEEPSVEIGSSEIEEEKVAACDIGSDADWEEPKLLVDVLGGVTSEGEGLIIDGDEFFDTNDDLVDSEDDSSAVSNMFDDAIDESIALKLQSVLPKEYSVQEPESSEDEACDLEVASVESSSSSQALLMSSEEVREDVEESLESDEKVEGDDFGGVGAVVLQDTPLPRMYVPGKIAHVYSHRGVYKAAFVPRNFREIRRISLAGNMLSDHKSESYYHGLLEVRSVRQADENAPLWTAFDEDSTCSCCCSAFTWASTSKSEAQEARDKHNCRSCGTLVCEPCSTNRMPLPSIGLTMPGRVCDRCYNDIDGVVTGSAPTAAEFVIDGSDRSDAMAPALNENDKPERQRARRSSVVDELVHRVQASPLKCS